MRVDDALITAAYFSIPAQILVSLYKYPRLAHMPLSILILLVLFALFVFLCGFGHLLRCMEIKTNLFLLVNYATAIVSVSTALYLIPLVPNLMNTIDLGLRDLDRLDETTEAKRKLLTFMAFLCHEIRNPLFAVTSTITFLGDEPLTKGQRKSLDSINQSANLMLRIVNDVLDISKLESGKLELEEREFCLRQLFDGVACALRTHIQQTHKDRIDFTFTLDEKVPKVVCGDSVRILQIVYNLLSNASKFTSSGYVDFSVSVVNYADALANKWIDTDDTVSKDSTNEEFSVELLGMANGISQNARQPDDDLAILKIVVSDSGCGIPPDRIGRIFEPFSQSKISDYREYGGTGLGLSIIARLTKSMGGTIHVDSVENEGSTFTVYVPAIVASSVPPAFEDDTISRLTSSYNPMLPALIQDEESQVGTDTAHRAGQPSHESLQPKPSTLERFDFPSKEAVVLVVDDNCVNRKLLGRMLTYFNLEYEQARNGREAVEKVLASRNVTGSPKAPYYRLIFMDMSMPVMDGSEAIALIRRRQVQIPIVALTANALIETRDEAIKAGATHFATKPITRDDLHVICRKFLLDPTYELKDAADGNVPLDLL